MNRLTRGLLRGAAVAVVVAATSGAAFAGGNPNKDPGTPPGNSANAPGQQKKAAQQAAPAQPAPAAASSAPAAPKPAKSDSPPAAKGKAKGRAKQAARPSSPTSAPVFANPAGKPRRNVPSGAVAGYQAHPESFGGPGNSGTHKYTVCHNGHAITVDVHSWNAHVIGHGDTLLPYGTKGKQACGSSAPATPTPTPPTTTPQSCPSTTTTVVGVWHHTGSSTNPFVLIHPSSHSAHMKGKHPEDRIATVTTTSTAACGSSSSPTGATGGAPPNAAGSSIAGATTNGNAHASKTAVAGAQKTIKSRRSRAGGVLGATKRAGSVLASSVRKGTLPFTGFPIWLAALIGAALIAGGFALRRVRPTTTT